jgi:hypothetical protein
MTNDTQQKSIEPPKVTFSFTDSNWYPFPQARNDAIGASPNQLWANNSTKAGALVVKKSPKYAEYALSKAGLDYLHDAEQAGKVTGIVVFAAWIMGKLTVVKIKSVAEVVAALDNTGLREGPFGLYWWVDLDSTFAPPRPEEEWPY